MSKELMEVRKLRELAWRRELELELGKLEEHFRSWRSGAIDAFELSERIQRFQDGEFRELSRLYTSGAGPLAAASAIARGVISETEVSPQLLEAIAGSLQYLRGSTDD